jgi:small subunit ribosomal protein S17
MKQTKAKKRVVGTVTSDRMQGTISVDVERLVRHPVYKKYLKRTSRYKADDSQGEARVGDVVEIEPCRPLSKTKSWRLVRVLRRAHAGVAEPGA